MADELENVTPEEKLLNVIQSGGEKTESAVEGPVEAEKADAVQASAVADEKTVVEEKPSESVAEEPVAEVKNAEPVSADVSAPEVKGKMKLAKTPKKAPQADGSGSAAEPVKPDELANEPVAPADGGVAFAKRQKGKGSGITTINRMLAAGILVLLGMSALEVFRVVKGNGTERMLVDLEIPEMQSSQVSAVEVQQVYGSDIFWRSSGAGGNGGSQTTTQTITVNTTPWADYMKQNIRLMGISMRANKPDSEAILIDNTDKRMYFVKLGSSFSVQGVDVRLDDLESERARFSDGKNSIELK